MNGLYQNHHLIRKKQIEGPVWEVEKDLEGSGMVQLPAQGLEMVYLWTSPPGGDQKTEILLEESDVK